MFICDVTTAEFQNSHPFPYKQSIPCVVRICENRKRFSVVSKSVKDKICCLEQLLLYDIGERGVENLSVEGDLLKSLLVLYKASSVGITFGFPVFGDKPIAEETDGMPGAIAIAKTLCALGKHVSLIVDKRNEVMLKKIIQQCLGLKILKRDIPVLVYDRQVDRKEAAKHFLYPNGSEMSARFDHLVSIERTGPNRNGQYCSMKGLSLKDDLIAPVEDLFKLGKNVLRPCFIMQLALKLAMQFYF